MKITSRKVKRWLEQGAVLERTTLTGPLSGEDRFTVLQQAGTLLRCPSYTENFGQVVAGPWRVACPS